MLQYKNKNTPVAVVRNTGRSGENYDITTLEKMLDFEINMFTTVIIGNSKTFVKNGKMITPREDIRLIKMDWVIGGTKDSRDFIKLLSEKNINLKNIILTTVSDYGKKLAEESGWL